MVDSWPDVGQGMSPVPIILTSTTLASTMSLVVFAVWQLSGDETVAESLAVSGTGIGRCGTVKR